MFPFWEIAIAPLLEAAGVRQIVEIGALRGENTKQIVDALGPECVLHVIDPVPDFDPAEHERQFAGQYVFHQDLSVNVLGSMPAMDAALIDGDHNWYTVYNELRLLARGLSPASGKPLAAADPARRLPGRTGDATCTTSPSTRSQLSSASPTTRRGMRPGNARSCFPGGA